MFPCVFFNTTFVQIMDISVWYTNWFVLASLHFFQSFRNKNRIPLKSTPSGVSGTDCLAPLVKSPNKCGTVTMYFKTLHFVVMSVDVISDLADWMKFWDKQLTFCNTPLPVWTQSSSLPTIEKFRLLVWCIPRRTPREIWRFSPSVLAAPASSHPGR